MNQQYPPVSPLPRFESLGQLLRWHRQRLGLSQEAIAEAIGASARSIRRWEQDQAIPQEVMRTRICNILGIDPGLLLAGVLLEEAPPVSPSLWLVPFPRNPFFTGRAELLQTLHRRLRSEQRLALSQSLAISGLGGIGKTQIALEYAYQYREDYAAVFWISAATQESVQAGLVTVAECLQLPEKEEHDHTRITRAVTQWLATHQDWLLILDNADDVTLVHNVLPAEQSGHLLLTTRAQALGPLAERLEVETMGLAEGSLFLLRRARLLSLSAFLDQVAPDHLAAAEAIAIEMDFLPLALDQAGAYIEEVGCSLSTYLELYRTHRASLLRRRGQMPENYPESVATTWSLNFQQVEQANPAAAALLRLCAFLEPDAIPEELFSEGGTVLGAVLAPIATNALALNEAMEELRKYSLVQRDPEARQLRLHHLVQAVLKDSMGREEQSQWAGRAVRATSLVFPEDVETTTWPRCQRFLPQAQACNRLIQEHAFVFAEAAALLQWSARYLYDVLLYEQAAPLFQQALRIWEQLLGPEHPEAVYSLHGLALLSRVQRKYEQAEALHLKALRILEQAHGPEHPDLARSLGELGGLHIRLGRYEQAEPLLQRALCIVEQTRGPKHPDLAQPLNKLAVLYERLGEYKQAELLYRRALSILEQAFGLEHPGLAQPLNNLAVLYARQGRYEHVEPLLQQALRIWEQVRGPEHPDVAYALNNLGELYGKQEKYEQMEQLCLRALRIWEQALGPEHPSVADALNNLGELYGKQEKYEQAELLYRRALRILEQAPGSEHLSLVETLHGLANLYSRRGTGEQAESLYQRALSIREQALGEHHLETTELLDDFAALREAQGNHQEAVVLYQRALMIREQVFGTEHPKTGETRAAYAAVLQCIASGQRSNEHPSLAKSGQTVGNSAVVHGEWSGAPLATPPCPHCHSQTTVSKSGTNRSGTQRFRCRSCSCSFTPHTRRQGYDSSLKSKVVELREQGKSYRAIARTVGVDHHTVRRWIQAAHTEQPERNKKEA